MNLFCFSGDITMKNGFAVCNSKLLALYFAYQPEAISLFHFIKNWHQLCEVNGWHAIKGYTLALLVLFYLQTSNLMPAIHTAQRSALREMIDGKLHKS